MTWYNSTQFKSIFISLFNTICVSPDKNQMSFSNLLTTASSRKQYLCIENNNSAVYTNKQGVWLLKCKIHCEWISFSFKITSKINSKLLLNLAFYTVPFTHLWPTSNINLEKCDLGIIFYSFTCRTYRC